MKKLYIMVCIVFIATTIHSQPPQKISYQAVVRSSSNLLVVNQQIGLRVSILFGSINGIEVYKEIFNPNPQTNSNGLIAIEIGSGIPVSGTFSEIDWPNGPYFIKTEMDLTGGTNYTIVGTNQLLSVPYALHAKSAESLTGGIVETDPSFTAWDKSTGITITEGQINDFGSYLKNENDPYYLSSQAAKITSGDISKLNHLSGTNTGDQDGSETRIESGTNIWINGNGTIGDPYIVNYYPAHYIGELFGGGVVFWVDHTGYHGLICSMVAFNEVQWSDVTSTEIGETAQSYWNGQSNSNAIIAQSLSSSAADLCNEYTNDDYGTDIFSDWYLPSKGELKQLCNSYYMIQKTLESDGNVATTPISENLYWSSTEALGGGNIAWGLHFGTGDMEAWYKTTMGLVRAIRAF